MRESFANGGLQVEASDGIARLTLARPERRNALDGAMWRALGEVAAWIEAQPAVLVTVVSGAGGHFCAGADIRELETAFATAEAARCHQAAIADGVEALAGLSKPLIAAIEGACFGGGVALALACDVRIAGSGARFAVTPARLGLTYGATDTARLVAAVGQGYARRMLYTAQPIDADEALRAGLVQACVGDALAAALQDARAIAAVSQYSVRAMKALVAALERGGDVPDDRTLDDPVAGADFAEGRHAFLEKRPPVFRYR